MPLEPQNIQIEVGKKYHIKTIDTFYSNKIIIDEFDCTIIATYTGSIRDNSNEGDGIEKPCLGIHFKTFDGVIDSLLVTNEATITLIN
jgi:hypothetical protein